MRPGALKEHFPKISQACCKLHQFLRSSNWWIDSTANIHLSMKYLIRMGIGICPYVDKVCHRRNLRGTTQESKLYYLILYEQEGTEVILCKHENFILALKKNFKASFSSNVQKLLYCIFRKLAVSGYIKEFTW